MAKRPNLAVTLALHEIVCFDEGDGWGDAEPYLWVCFYKIDGSTCRLGPNGTLAGTVTIERRLGGHGNLQNTDVDAGDNVGVPASIGTWHTELVPIPVDPAWIPIIQMDPSHPGQEDLPGLVGVMWILMEEDSLSDSAALAGYSAACSTLEVRLNEVLLNLGVLNPSITGTMEEDIKKAISDAAKNAIKDNLNFLEAAWAFLGSPDDPLGGDTFRVSHDELEPTTGISQPTIPYSRRWKGGPIVPGSVSLSDDTGDGEWEIRGRASAVELEPQTFQVTCVKRGGGEFIFNKTRISALGVLDKRGNRGIMWPGEVIRRLAQGDHFVVISPNGTSARVYQHPPTTEAPFWYLTTFADQTKGNNLGELPQCG
ncbi:MAG: hypothetical protein ABI743_00630 [bacterium]